MTVHQTPATPLSISESYASIRDFINAVRAVALTRYGVDVGYRKVSRVYHRWKVEDCERWDNPRHAQDKQMRDDPTGETAIREVMRELAALPRT